MSSDLLIRVQEKLKELVEEETGRKFGELNVVTEVSQISDGVVLVRYRPLSPYSPTAVNAGRLIRAAAMGVDGVTKVSAECSGHMMDELVNRLVNREEKQKR
jgi:metal-sulfur cluster biosynthetic enzyme